MNEIIDYWSNSVFTYGHGIVCQDCFARKYSEGGVAVQFVSTGTFVRVHSVREDDVLFCIVHDDMQIESNQLVCKMTDIIYVPESLWGPLFTIKKFERLPLVKDSTTAVNMGNISVGHMVQVLGPDNTCICIANVTFRNTIHKLGAGVFFGLQVIAPKENLQAIVRKVSIMEPGTKGFPRGCDLVITIDKIRPYTSKFNEENLQLSCSKESQKKSFSSKEDINNLNFKFTMPLNFKDKFTNNFRKSQLVNFSHPQHSVNSASLKKSSNSENAFIVGEEVIYMDGNSPEKGIITWIGKIKNLPKVEVEFENGMKNGSDLNDGSEDFKNEFKHSLILAPADLIKLSDYVMCNTKEKTHHKVNNINNNSTITNNNNNNNNNYSSNTNNNINNINNNIDTNNKLKLVTSCVSKYPNEGKYDTSRITSASKHCAKHTEKKTNCSEPVFIKSNEECSQNKYLCTSEYYRSCPGFELQLQHNSKSFDYDDFSEKKISSKRCCSSLDCELEHFKNFKQQNYVSLTKGNHCQNSYDLFAQNWCTQDKTFSAGSNNSVVPPHFIKEILNKYHEQVHYRFINSNKSMADKDSDDPYLPVPVLEFNNLARKSQRECGGNIEYVRSGEVCVALPGHPRRASPKKLVPESIKLIPSGDSYKGVLVTGNRHTLISDFYENVEADCSTVPLKEHWDSPQAENSSSDEGSLHYYDAPKNGTFDYAAHAELTKGSVVELFYRGEAHYGVIRWIGAIPDEHDARTPRLMAGVEMEEEMEGFTDGTFNNTRYFQCNPKKALFVPLSKCRKDSRFLEETQRFNAATYYGQIDCPIVEGIIPPINRKEDIESICGKNRGIQGHHNSCYLDATLFSMFAFTSVFDSLLYRPPGKHDIPEYGEVQRVLREEIVNPLRKNLYVRADRVMKLRTLLDKLSSVSGLTSEEKDPEEFLNSLLAQILKAEPFLKLISGQEAFHHQLFVEKDDRLIFPSVQQLFEQSFVTSDIKLKQIPSCLIIQMPRFGKSFKMYSRILPPQLLDITDVMENSPRQCTVCGKLAEYECKDCFGQQGMGSGLEGISFCKSCLETAHTHHSRTRHDYRSLTVPVEFFELRDHCIIPRVYLELFAVVCIETSHYVAFVKCGSGSDAPWCFFDSMADRKGEQNGYNIPEMVPCPDLPYWLSEEGAKIMNEMNDDRQLPEHAKRLFSDAYMCMYQSPDLMMYR